MPSQWWMWHLFTPLELCVAFKTIAWDALWFMSWRESNGSCSPHTNMYLYMYIYIYSIWICCVIVCIYQYYMPAKANLGRATEFCLVRHPLVSQTFRKDLDLWSSKLIFFLKKCPSSFWGTIQTPKLWLKQPTQKTTGRISIFCWGSSTQQPTFLLHTKGTHLTSLDSRNDGLKVPTFAWGLRLGICRPSNVVLSSKVA